MALIVDIFDRTSNVEAATAFIIVNAARLKCVQELVRESPDFYLS